MAKSREKLLAATITSIAGKGYAATTVDEICAKAGLTKGAFFHHFSSKQSLAVAAVEKLAEEFDAFYAAAPYNKLDDPLERILGYLDLRKDMLRAPIAVTSSVVGLLIGEVSETHPDLSRACKEYVAGQLTKTERDIANAIARHGAYLPFSAKSLALYMHAVLQGMHILAKSADDIGEANESIDHLRLYINVLFRQSHLEIERDV